MTKFQIFKEFHLFWLFQFQKKNPKFHKFWLFHTTLSFQNVKNQNIPHIPGIPIAHVHSQRKNKKIHNFQKFHKFLLQNFTKFQSFQIFLKFWKFHLFVANSSYSNQWMLHKLNFKTFKIDIPKFRLFHYSWRVLLKNGSFQILPYI